MVVDNNELDYGFSFEDNAQKEEFLQIVKQVKAAVSSPVICFVSYDQLGEMSRTVMVDRLVINMFVDEKDFRAITDLSMDHLAGKVVMSVSMTDCMTGQEGGICFDI